MLKFPYTVSFIKNIKRNFLLFLLVPWHKWVKKEDSKKKPYPAAMKVIMKQNLKLRCYLYKKDFYAVKLLIELVKEFKKEVESQGSIPILVFMPQKDDLLFIKKKKNHYYNPFIKEIKEIVKTIDCTSSLIEEIDLDSLYSDKNEYGGHYTAKGNQRIAKIIFDSLPQE